MQISNRPKYAASVQTRIAATRLFRRVAQKRVTLEIAINDEQLITTLQPSDRGFAILMCREALRNGHRMRTAIAPHISRKWVDIDPSIQAHILIGLTQIWETKTPIHASVSETVAAVKAQSETRAASGFVNAILRKATTLSEHYENTPITRILPEWLYKNLHEYYSASAITKFCKGLTHPDRFHISLRDPAAATMLLDQGFTALDETHWGSPQGATDPTSFDSFAEGQFWVQNIAAAAPAKFLMPQPQEDILDLCAAPGGKTMQFASLVGSDANITALDFSRGRLKRLRENLTRTGLGRRITIINADFGNWSAPRTYDKILLDAPCTALGTLARHPESLWIKQPGDVIRNANRQRQFLQRALTMLEADGVLVYCVCSPLYDEGQGVVDDLISSGQATRLPIRAEEAGALGECITPFGDMHILGCNAVPDADGFYIARLRLSRPGAA